MIHIGSYRLLTNALSAIVMLIAEARNATTR